MNTSSDSLHYLLTTRDPAAIEALRARAVAVRDGVYGRRVFLRGLIEISNHCKNDCLYCGIRRSQRGLRRYRLSKEEILDCCQQGHALGFRTFVLQGGEDGWYSDEVLCDVVASIRRRWPDCAITLSLGERGRESFRRLREAGADRYLLRHETANVQHYAQLHPPQMSFDHRMQCLHDLRDLGFQVGCGMMVGSPFQTVEHLLQDLQFIASFRPEMVGIGPFVPAAGTPFGSRPAGSVELTLRCLSLVRVLHPTVLLPATTALGALHPRGRELAVQAGANVLMPNLSPQGTRRLYSLYDNKPATGSEAAESAADIRARLAALGFEATPERGDHIAYDAAAEDGVDTSL